MKNTMLIGIAVAVSCVLLSGCYLPGKVSLEKNDTIVFLGDSITQEGVRDDGYVTLVSRAIEGVYPDLDIEVIGAGLGGHKVRDCLKRLDRDVIDKNPTIVLIYIGINDVWWWNGKWGKGSTREEFESGLNEMIRRIDAVGAEVILCTPSVIGEKTDSTNEFDAMLDEYSDISRKVARAAGCRLLDLRREFMTYLEEHNSENVSKGILTRDGVHLNERGNLFLAGLVLDAFGVPRDD